MDILESGSPAGRRSLTAIAFQGADTICEAAILNASGHAARGMAYLAADFSRSDRLAAAQEAIPSPGTDRVAKAMIDDLESRPDVDPNRVAMQGTSMDGYGAPRAASGEKHIKAALISSGSSTCCRIPSTTPPNPGTGAVDHRR